MAVIIGAGSTVTSTQFSSGGIVSVQFGFNPEVDRLWELGSFTPYDSTVTKTRTLSLNVYGQKPSGAGGSTPLSVTPSTSCTDAGTVNIQVNPASCSDELLSFSDDFFITGYSYQKENLGYGQESWSFTSKPEVPDYSGTIVMLRGIAEGTVSTGDGIMTAAQMGLTVDETASNDSEGQPIQGESGSVPAGTPGLGNYEIQRYVIVTSVGGSIGKNDAVDGLSGQASIQIPMNPVFI
jgi:hypothetical protein